MRAPTKTNNNTIKKKHNGGRLRSRRALQWFKQRRTMGVGRKSKQHSMEERRVVKAKTKNRKNERDQRNAPIVNRYTFADKPATAGDGVLLGLRVPAPRPQCSVVQSGIQLGENCHLQRHTMRPPFQREKITTVRWNRKHETTQHRARGGKAFKNRRKVEVKPMGPIWRVQFKYDVGKVRSKSNLVGEFDRESSPLGVRTRRTRIFGHPWLDRLLSLSGI